MKARDPKRRFWRISAAGIFFEGGAAAVNSSTIIAALVHGLTGSAVAVGAASAISRYGWLFPQLFVAYFAQRHRRRMPFYMLGAFGRATCLTVVAGLLMVAGEMQQALVVVLFFVPSERLSQPTLPSRLTSSSFCASTAKSIGS